jgi:hypothetical protein
MLPPIDGKTAMASILKSLWSRLAGGGTDRAAEEPRLEAVEYKGYRIRPAPYAAAGGFQTAGVVEKDFPDGVKTHEFIRAETHPSRDEAAAFAIVKGKQIVDQNGDRIFGGR